jgi:hypothetical protein
LVRTVHLGSGLIKNPCWGWVDPTSGKKKESALQLWPTSLVARTRLVVTTTVVIVVVVIHTA